MTVTCNVIYINSFDCRFCSLLLSDQTKTLTQARRYNIVPAAVSQLILLGCILI